MFLDDACEREQDELREVLADAAAREHEDRGERQCDYCGAWWKPGLGDGSHVTPHTLACPGCVDAEEQLAAHAAIERAK